MSDRSRLLHIHALYDYNAWANARVLAAAMALTRDQLNAPGDGAYGSVRETLVHTMSAQGGWLARWQSTLPIVPPTGRLDPADSPTWRGLGRGGTRSNGPPAPTSPTCPARISTAS